MEDRDAARAERRRDLVEQQRRRGDETGHPAAPGGVIAAARQRIAHQVELVIAHVREAVLRTHPAAGRDEARRTLDGDDLARTADDPGEVRGRIAGSRADVQNAPAGRDAGLPPAVLYGRPPDAVLQPEARELLVVRAEEIVAVGRHGAGFTGHGCSWKSNGRSPLTSRFTSSSAIASV